MRIGGSRRFHAFVWSAEASGLPRIRRLVLSLRVLEVIYAALFSLGAAAILWSAFTPGAA